MMEKGFMLWEFQAPNWAENFESKHQTSYTCEEILENVRKLEQKFMARDRFMSLIIFSGMAVMMFAPLLGSTYVALSGLFLALITQTERHQVINRCGQSICMLNILWDIRKREEEALVNSEIQDL